MQKTRSSLKIHCLEWVVDKGSLMVDKGLLTNHKGLWMVLIDAEGPLPAAQRLLFLVPQRPQAELVTIDDQC